MVREWDPRTAPSEEIESVLATLNAAVSVDLPDDPPWRGDSYREYLSVTMPGERRVCWLAESGPGAAARGEPVLGQANVLLLGDIGVLDLVVHPKARRAGLGRELLGAAVRRAFAEGFRSIGVEFHADGPPEDLYEAYAEAKEIVRESYDLGDLELRPSSYDPDRLRTSLATLHARGLKPYIVLGIHEPTGKVAGLTEVVVPAQRPTRADQYDTVVVPKHRGYGLGRAIKARMLFELRTAEPCITEVQTWNAFENEPMLKVNSELGFQPDRQWSEYEADIADLARLLDVNGA